MNERDPGDMLETHFKTLPSLSAKLNMESQRGPYPEKLRSVIPQELFAAAEAEIPSWPDYSPTPLRNFDRFADDLGLSAVRYKDESGRFGLGSFKALGGAYAVMQLLADQLAKSHGRPVDLAEVRAGNHAKAAAELTVVTATDGNHGRSVAWGARQAGCRCRIYIHSGVSQGRKQAMEALGAQVVRIDGDYDTSVQQCAQEAEQNGWYVVSDTSYPGYDEIPRYVMAGYGVMAAEVLDQYGGRLPTHVFIQAGVGGLAASICARLWMALGINRPRFVIVEADRAACLLASAQAGKPKSVEIEEETIMAGLSCGEVSLLGWDVLSCSVDHFVTVSDDFVADAMRCLASGDLGGGEVEGGECSATGLLALIAAASDPDIRSQFNLDKNSDVLLFGTEGATDRELYQAILDNN